MWGYKKYSGKMDWRKLILKSRNLIPIFINQWIKLKDYDKPGFVVNVKKSGYMLHSQCIRSAQVVKLSNNIAISHINFNDEILRRSNDYHIVTL